MVYDKVGEEVITVEVRQREESRGRLETCLLKWRPFSRRTFTCTGG